MSRVNCGRMPARGRSPQSVRNQSENKIKYRKVAILAIFFCFFDLVTQSEYDIVTSVTKSKVGDINANKRPREGLKSHAIR